MVEEDARGAQRVPALPEVPHQQRLGHRPPAHLEPLRQRHQVRAGEQSAECIICIIQHGVVVVVVVAVAWCCCCGGRVVVVAVVVVVVVVVVVAVAVLLSL